MRGFASLFGRRGVLAAASAALIILGTYVVQRLLSSLLYAGVMISQGAVDGLFPSFLLGTVLGVLPFVIGVFLSLWLLAPVAAELHIAHVITRSLLAAACGAVIVFVVTLLESLFSHYDVSSGQVFGWAFGLFSTVSASAGWAFSNALFGALNLAISLAPITILACVLLWIWLRAHPAKHPVAGLIDEV